METDKAPIESEQDKRDKKAVRDADELKITMKTQGWKTIIQPMIDKMITDSMGCKKDGVWSEGALADCDIAGIEVEKMIWYRKALIEFNNSLQAILQEAERAKERKAAKDKAALKEGEEEIMMPMHDTSYNTEEKADTFTTTNYDGDLTSA